MSVFAIIIIAFIIMLAVLGHGVWHGPEIAFLNVVAGFFTGGHVTG